MVSELHLDSVLGHLLYSTSYKTLYDLIRPERDLIAIQLLQLLLGGGIMGVLALEGVLGVLDNLAHQFGLFAPLGYGKAHPPPRLNIKRVTNQGKLFGFNRAKHFGGRGMAQVVLHQELLHHFFW